MPENLLHSCLCYPTPARMMLVRMLLVSMLPLLVQSLQIHQCSFHNITQDMPPALASLECYNDYTTHIRCTWEEYPPGGPSLVIEASKFEEIKGCIPDGPDVQLQSGKVRRSCVYKTEIFSWKERTVYFNTTCASKITLNIAQHGKVLSPVNLTVTKVKGKGRMLNWSSAYTTSSTLSHRLTYQLKYKRHGHDWTVLDNITATHLLIKEEELMVAYSYEARVRARGPVGWWSDWSTPVFWVTEEEGPFNLQCVIDGRGVSCSWQVWKEHAQFLSYHLCGHTTGSKQHCRHCVSHTKWPDHPVLDFTCLVDSAKPELLTMELKTVRRNKNISDFLNVKPPAPTQFKVKKKNDVWKLTWDKPQVYGTVNLCYELRLCNNETLDYYNYSFTGVENSAEISSSSLKPATRYMIQVRALPCQTFKGQPSDWSKPVFFKNDPASRITVIIYCVIAFFVAVFFLAMYNALPAFHRRVVQWKVSIPSPFKSRVLEEMSSKGSPAGWGNVCSEKEKTSVCIMQPSDNPTIYKGSICECPLLPYTEDSLIKTDWMPTPDHSSSYTEGSGISIRSVLSFTGPYILCRQDSSQTEILEASSFFSDMTDCGSIAENPKDSPPVNGGYVTSPPTVLPSAEDSTPHDFSAKEIMKSSSSQLPEHNPPAYTPSPTAMPGALFTHPSGYCMMPKMEADVAAWMQASAPPLQGDTQCQQNDAGVKDQCARGYVTLSEPKT